MLDEYATALADRHGSLPIDPAGESGDGVNTSRGTHDSDSDGQQGKVAGTPVTEATTTRRTSRALPNLIRLLALNAFVTGLGCAVFGPAFLPGSQGEVEPNLAQEFRFLAVWWVAAGIYLLSLARRVHSAPGELRIVCAVFAASGVARWVSFATYGWPHPMFIAVAVLEIVAFVPLLFAAAAARTSVTSNPGHRRRRASASSC